MADESGRGEKKIFVNSAKNIPDVVQKIFDATILIQLVKPLSNPVQNITLILRGALLSFLITQIT